MQNDSPFETFRLFYGEEALQEKSIQLIDSYRSGLSKVQLEKVFWQVFRVEPVTFCKDNQIFQLFNEIMMEYHHNEAFIKSTFLKWAMSRSKNAGTWAYEIPSGESRADLCYFGRNLTAYEIKTDFDSLDRLSRQLEDYLHYFEQVYVIMSAKRYYSSTLVLPDPVGIILYREKEKSVSYFEIKKAQRLVEDRCELSRAGDDEQLTDLKQWRAKMRKTYAPHWDFFLEHKQSVYEIDYQWVFKNRCLPPYLANPNRLA